MLRSLTPVRAPLAGFALAGAIAISGCGLLIGGSDLSFSDTSSSSAAGGSQGSHSTGTQGNGGSSSGMQGAGGSGGTGRGGGSSNGGTMSSSNTTAGAGGNAGGGLSTSGPGGNSSSTSNTNTTGAGGAGPCATDGTPCGLDGFCNSGSCDMTDCYISGVFYSNATINPKNDCQVCSLINSHTTWSFVADTTSCSGGTGKCAAGDCCTGCITGGLCNAGIDPQYCGAAGAQCMDCENGTGEPNSCTANDSSCAGRDSYRAISCSGGTCQLGTKSCCPAPLPNCVGDEAAPCSD